MKHRLDPFLCKRLGLNRQWNGEDRDEVLEYNGRLWIEFKERYFEEHKEEIRERLLAEGRFHGHVFNASHFPVEYIHGFIKTLEDLHHNHGYSLTDIGNDFGLSRERIRQHIRDFNLKRSDQNVSMYRIWNDDEERFVNISPEDLETILRESKRKRRKENKERIKQKHIRAIHDFQRKHGRVPSVSELGPQVGYERKSSLPIFARYWGYNLRNKESSITPGRALDNLYRAAGIEERPDGRERKPILT